MKSWFEHLGTTKSLVIKYLKEHPHTRESDVELFYMILKDYYRAIPHNKKSSIYEEQFMTDLYVLLKYAPDKGTVSRMRRRIQNDDHMYQSTEDVKRMRDELETKFRKWASQ